APGAAQDEDVTELTVMVSNVPSVNALKAVAAAYKEDTGITVSFLEVPSDQLSSKLILDGQSQQGAFDIVQYDQPAMASIVPAGGLLPLDDYIDGDEEWDKDDFAAALQDYARLDDVTYGVPLSTEPYVNFYRQDLYDEHGLTPASTWDEVDSNAKAVSDLGSGYYGFAGPFGPSAASERYFERLLANGGRVLDPETNEPLLDGDLATEVAKDFLDLAPYSPEIALSGVASDSATAFKQENVGQNINPSGWYGQLDDPEQSQASGNVGVAAVPLEDNGDEEAKNILKGWLIGINAHSTKQDAAWDFLSYALGKESVQHFIDAGAPVPGRTSTLENPEYNEQLPYLQYLAPTIEDGTSLPVIPEMPRINTEVSQTLNSLATSGGDVDRAMDDLNESVRRILVEGGTLEQ
ncbi:MAG: ABC transporter substrate-binding protein, partial [Microbacterium sp.]